MTYDVQKLLNIALNEVGYLEKETYNQLDEKTANAGDENYTKYQRDLAKLNYFNGSKKGIAWCAVFVCWCFVQAFGKVAALTLLCQPSSGNCGAGCQSAMNYFKKKDQFYKSNPRPGDQIIFLSKDKTEASHTGLVYKVDATYVYTVEGNTSSASGVIANGGAVATKKYKLTYDRIAGYGRPNYEGVEMNDTEATENNVPEQKNDTSATTAWVSVTKGSTVNYRQKPSQSASKVIGMNRIKHGEQVKIKSKDDTWAYVEYKGYHGYVMTAFLTQKDPNESIEQPIISEQLAQNIYITVRGDTLWNISKKFLGAGNKYKKILEVNGMKNTIIRPGMVLKIPEA